MCVMNMMRGWLCSLPLAGQVDDQVAGLGRHRDARVGVIEVDRARRHAGLLQRRGDLAPDRGLLAGDALDGEEAHEAGAAAVSTGMMFLWSSVRE